MQDFAYINTNLENRNELIVDGDENEENDCEQSDMVQIILNLALVDDKFVEKIKFESGISTQLEQHKREDSIARS